jgi:hypothetical protein
LDTEFFPGDEYVPCLPGVELNKSCKFKEGTPIFVRKINAFNVNIEQESMREAIFDLTFL